MRNTTLAKRLCGGKIAVAALVLVMGAEPLPSHAVASGAAATQEHKTMNAEQALSAKQQAIPLIAAFMATSNMPRLNAALNQGLDAGLTISEAKEILVQLYAYTGFPRSLNALGELMKVLEERKQRGIQDAAGREPSRPVPTGDALLAAGTANQTRISGAPVRGPLFDFAPVINQYLQAHLFGDIFERDNFDWQSRELATVGALAATPGVEAQLRSHMRASMNVGLTASQLRQLTQVLSNDESLELRAVISGQVIGQLAGVTAAPYIRTKQLVPLLVDHIPDRYNYFVYFGSRSSQTARARAFIDLTVKRLVDNMEYVLSPKELRTYSHKGRGAST